MEREYVIDTPPDAPGVTAVTLRVGQVIYLDMAEGVVRNAYGTELFRLLDVTEYAV